MEDGLVNKKIAFIIQARMKSTRLPGKILLPIPLGHGKPLLSWIIDELKTSALDHHIIVATSKEKENDVLADFCQSSGIECYRGDEDNVLSRFTDIVKNGGYQCVVRLTSDNPFLDISILEETIYFHLKSGNDYTNTRIMPLGMNIEVIAGKALLDTEKHQLADPDKEHVSWFIKNNKKYKKGTYVPDVNPEFYKIRLTIDYPSDYTLASAILSQGSKTGERGIKLIEKIFKTYSWLFEANENNIQKKQSLNLKDELIEAGHILQSLDFIDSAEILNQAQNKL